jgi:hypothetical protein
MGKAVRKKRPSVLTDGWRFALKKTLLPAFNAQKACRARWQAPVRRSFSAKRAAQKR